LQVGDDEPRSRLFSDEDGDAVWTDVQGQFRPFARIEGGFRLIRRAVINLPCAGTVHHRVVLNFAHTCCRAGRNVDQFVVVFIPGAENKPDVTRRSGSGHFRFQAIAFETNFLF